jgi:PST family polysaccharide transporter
MTFSRDRLRHLLRHEVVKNTALLYTVQVGSYIFPLLTLPYLSRVLGPSKLGLVAFAQSFIAYFLMATEYGFNLTATRSIAINRENPEAVTRTFNSVMAAKALLCGLSMAAMIVIVAAVPRFRGDWLLYFVSFLAVIGNLLFPLWLYQGLQILQHVAARDLGAKFLSLVAIFLLIHREKDYILAAGIQSGALALAGLVGLVMVPRLTKVRFQIPAWSEVVARLREGAPMFISMAAMTLYSSTNIFILGLVSTSAEVGYYSTASRITIALRMLVGPVVGALYPHISHMAAKSQGDVIRFLRRYSLLLSAPFFLIGVAMLIGAPLIESILFGPKYLPATVLLRIMAFSPFLCAMAHSYTSYYMLAFGYDKEWTRMVVIGAVINFAALIPLLHFLRGGQAVAITTTILDVYIVVASYIFYLKTSPALLRSKEENVQV